MKPQDIPDKVWKLFEDPSHWTQGCSARDKNGKKVLSTVTEPCSFCLYGGIYAVYDKESSRPTDYIRLKSIFSRVKEAVVTLNRQTKRFSNSPTLIQWNDSPHTTHAEVLSVLKSLDI